MDAVVTIIGLLSIAWSIALLVGVWQVVRYAREISVKLDRVPVAATSGADHAAGLDELPGPGTSRPGWYLDPEDPTSKRRWTGTAWSSDAPIAASMPWWKRPV